MAEWLEDRERLRRFVFSDPVRNAVMAQRIFYPRRESKYLVDDADGPKAVAALERPEDEFDAVPIAVMATDMRSGADVVGCLPDGKYWFHLSNENLLPVLRERMKIGWYGRYWLLALPRGGLKAQARHETRKLDASCAARVAKVWSWDWDATEYVKGRIEKGPSSGIFLDMELVAWNLTHFETDEVGVAGMLVVLPEYRSRGFAESVTIDVVKQIHASGKDVACHIHEDNQPSLSLSERIGFRRICIQIWGDGVTR